MSRVINHERNAEQRTRVLDLIRGSERPVPLARIARELGITSSSARPYVINLVNAGEITRTSYGNFQAVPREDDERVSPDDHPPAPCPRCSNKGYGTFTKVMGFAVIRRHQRILYRCPNCGASYYNVDPTSALRP